VHPHSVPTAAISDCLALMCSVLCDTKALEYQMQVGMKEGKREDAHLVPKVGCLFSHTHLMNQ